MLRTTDAGDGCFRRQRLGLCLYRTLQRSYPQWRARDLRLVAEGVEAFVFRTNTRAFGEVAIRVPKTADDRSGIKYRPWLEQEAKLAEHMRSHGVPTPQVFALHQGLDGFDFLVSEFVEGDHMPPMSQELGRVLSLIHQAPLLKEMLIFQGNLPFPTLIVNRVRRRARLIQQLTGIRLPLPKAAELRHVAHHAQTRRSLLHMDAYQTNIVTRQGKIVAILDWSQALEGDPCLELARVSEYGYPLDDPFWAGYGSRIDFNALPAGLELLYRLDTVTMLALLFLTQALDRSRAQQKITEAIEYCNRLQQSL